MAMKNTPYGKDRMVKSSESYINKALAGDTGPSNEIKDYPIDRPHQTIKTAFAMDNVKLAMPIETSMKNTGGIAGGVDNVKHSLTGTTAVNEEVGASGAVKHVIMPWH